MSNKQWQRRYRRQQDKAGHRGRRKPNRRTLKGCSRKGQSCFFGKYVPAAPVCSRCREAFQQHKGVYDQKNLFAACEGIEDDEQAHHFNIRQHCQKDLSQKEYGGEQTEDCQFTGVLLCQINNLPSVSVRRYPDPV